MKGCETFYIALWKTVFLYSVSLTSKYRIQNTVYENRRRYLGEKRPVFT